MSAEKFKERVLGKLSEEIKYRKSLGDNGHKIDDYQYDIALAMEQLATEIAEMTTEGAEGW